MRTIVHLSDIHFGRVDPRLTPPLIHAIRSIGPSLVAVSGDLTQRARRSEFVQARDFLQQLPFPQIIVPGNHDVPLYNAVARFAAPFGGYRRYIAPDLEPVYQDAELIVVGLNSARSVPFSGAGRVNQGQVKRAAARLAAAPRSAIRIVVSHHPFELPAGHGDGHLIGRARMAMEHLARVGADLFLAGHLHVSHVGGTAERYRIAGHSAVVVQAGTLSTRERGEPTSFNVVHIARPEMTIERHTWDDAQGVFRAAWSGRFRHSADGWASCS
jgi:3',5'-cyclic AMP phosphodiesterase CpdA